VTFVIDPSLLGLVDKVAVVSGASVRGLGGAHCIQLARAGCHVVVSSMDEERGAETVARVKALGREAIFVYADARRTEDAEKLMQATVSHFGRIDIGVNNAGGTAGSAPILDYAESDWSAVVDTCLRTVFVCSRAEALMMVQLGIRGSIINVSSSASFVANDNNCAYGAAKAAVNALTRTMAVEFARFGIRVNAVSPGTMTVSWSRGDLRESARPDDAEYRKVSERVSAMRRLGEPMEVAGTTVFLASNLSAYITGQTIRSDGGMTLRVHRPQRDRVPEAVGPRASLLFRD
jgi:NAD(P)-dependent dehydrogenase (short-subunit alcohol dehydrogenase family)